MNIIALLRFATNPYGMHLEAKRHGKDAILGAFKDISFVDHVINITIVQKSLLKEG
ncbi:4008_t:CDS:2 [Entrophospora sp. SA101]|nr:4008_t:CDS:2 [Entrophospora sp. SA101]